MVQMSKLVISETAGNVAVTGDIKAAAAVSDFHTKCVIMLKISKW